MDKISLTASMRSNLLSLQNISGQVDLTQNKLSTGKKVNSAIDNPSSYYTALSLNNRADDLNALLDSMGQAVSTIKAATTALESAADFLEQATAVAAQASETSLNKNDEPTKTYTKLDKSWFENQVGANGAVVATADELKAAVAAGKELICVYGAIEIKNEMLKLADNQKLVGTEYFANINENALWRDNSGKHFSSISFDNGPNTAGVVLGDNSLLADIEINHFSETGGGAVTAGKNACVRNITVNASSTTKQCVGIASYYGGNLTIEGNIEVYVNGNQQQPTMGIYGLNGNININNANISIRNDNNENATFNFGILIAGNRNLNINNSVIELDNCNLGAHYSSYGGNNVVVDSDSTLIFTTERSFLNLGANTKNNFTIKSGAKIYLDQSGPSPFQVQLNQDWSWEGTDVLTQGADYQGILSSFVETGKAQALANDNHESFLEAYEQYTSIINQYDSLIKDASYKGINLLQTDKLSVKFNEDNTASLNVQGKDMSSQALGFTVFEWQTQADIAQSLSEIASALKSIRNYSAELGNNYSIITTRQDFTESLINVLTEGADKLTLADMNEESANMLALQTRQQLAINSLSLASQASQSILKLF